MANKPKRNQATRPSRDKRGGGGSSKKGRSRKAKAEPVRTPTEATPTDSPPKPPLRAQRKGTHRAHSRDMTPKERKGRQSREEKRRADEVAAQQAHRKTLQKRGKGWGGARALRPVPKKGARRGR